MIKIFKNALIFFIGEILKSGAAILLIPVYTRYLTTSEYGIVATLSLAALLFSTLLNMGQAEAGMRFFFIHKDPQRRKMAMTSIWFFSILVGFFFSVWASFWGKGLFQVIFPSVPFYPYGLLLVWIVFFSNLELFPFILLKAEKKALQFSLLRFFGFLVRTSIIILFVVHLKKGALGKISADLIYLALASLVFIYIMRQYIIFHFSGTVIKKTLAYGLPLVFHQLSLWVINLSDRVCLQWFASLSLVGIYSIGYNLTTLVNFVSSSIGMAWTPFFFQGADQKDTRRQFARMSTYYVTIVAFFVLILMMFSRELILILTTSAYYNAMTIIPIVAIGYFFHALYKISIRALSYAKRTKQISLCTVFSACLNISLNILWIPRYGMLGAAWATLLSFLALFLLSYYFMQKYYTVPFEYRRFGKTVGVAGSVYCLSRFISMDTLTLNIFLKAIILCLYPIGLISFNFFTKDEKELAWKKLTAKFKFG